MDNASYPFRVIWKYTENKIKVRNIYIFLRDIDISNM